MNWKPAVLTSTKAAAAKVWKSASFVSKRHATTARFVPAFLNQQAMTVSATWAVTQREARRICKAMLRQRRSRTLGRFCPALETSHRFKIAQMQRMAAMLMRLQQSSISLKVRSGPPAKTARYTRVALRFDRIGPIRIDHLKLDNVDGPHQDGSQRSPRSVLSTPTEARFARVHRIRHQTRVEYAGNGTCQVAATV